MMTVQDSFIALPVFSFLQLEFECAPANVGQVRQEQMACFQVQCGSRIRWCRRKLKVVARPSEQGFPS